MAILLPPGWLVRYVREVHNLRYAIVLFWLLCIGMGAWQGLKLISVASIDLSPPPGSLSDVAQDALQSYFPDFATSSPLVILVQQLNGSSVLNQAVADFDAAMQSRLASYPDSLLKNVTDYQSFFVLLALGSDLAWSLVDATNTSTLIVLNCHPEQAMVLSSADEHFLSFVDHAVRDLSAQFLDPATQRARITGGMAFGRDVTEGTERDLLFMDGIGFPIALLVLALVLRSFRLLIIPVMNISASILTSFLIVYGVAQRMSIISFAPSLMMSLTIAMSIDYSLFQLTRYREELKMGSNINEAVLHMLQHSGHTVLVSGSTLMACFFGLMIFPVVVLRSPGLAAAIAIVITMLVSLTLTPALLFAFENFFKKSVDRIECCRNKNPENDLLLEADHDMAGDLDDLISHFSLRQSCWYKFASGISRVPLLVMVVILGLAAPCAYRALNFDRTTSILTFTPSHAVSTQTYVDLETIFGPGLLFPYDLIIVSPESTPVRSQEFFNEANNALKFVFNQKEANSSFLSVLQWNFTEVDQCLTAHSRQVDDDPDCFAIRTTWQLLVNEKSNVMLVQVHLQLAGQADPFGPEGMDWLRDVRDRMSAFEHKTPYKLLLAQGAAAQADLLDKVYSLFPIAIAVTIGLVFVLVGVAFRSLLVPLRSVLSIAATLSLVYGCAVFVYQNGVLNFLGFSGLHGSGALCWIGPILSFSIVVGLGLDYDVFLLTRVFEFRRSGVSDKHSILYGVTHTGGIITAAGLIMAIAFVGLLFSSEKVLNELSFFLVFAVLVDTFVIRTLLVPACMFLLGRLNWWPGTMPPSIGDQQYLVLNDVLLVVACRVRCDRGPGTFFISSLNKDET
eukprot:m.165058 g.165058  ORF g.165058 m.165058 type:complete len:848 (+) comp17149_c3_seq7:3642-6185(+)